MTQAVVLSLLVAAGFAFTSWSFWTMPPTERQALCGPILASYTLYAAYLVGIWLDYATNGGGQ